MIVNTFETQEDWLEARKGKITGSRLADIVVKRGTGEKLGFYELIAERIASNEEPEDPRERGHRLETEALHVFAEQTGRDIDTSLVIWQREDNKSIAISPDGFTKDFTEAFEVKCLSSAKHIEAIVTDTIPKEYEYQKLQYFIVNDDLKTLYFIMYDPRMPENLKLKYFVVNREDIAEEIAEYHQYQTEKLARVEEIINQLTF